MNILFVTYDILSVGSSSIRSASLLRALVDAGNQVDVIAARFDLPEHPNIRILSGNDKKPGSRRKIRLAVLRALGGKSYPVLHAVDDAVLYVLQLGVLKRSKVVYQASRCFSGVYGIAPAFWWKLMPSHYQRKEMKVLKRASLIFSSCDELTSDLGKIHAGSHVMQLQDIPVHSLFSRKELERERFVPDFPGGTSFVTVFSVLPGNSSELRTLLLSARKVIERIPDAAFYFKGVPSEQARAMASNLDIGERCVFLENDQTCRFLNALDMAHAAVFVPQPGSRYAHSEILTLMNSRALVVAVRERAYASQLSDQNSIQVDYTAASISEGLLRVVQEPLLSFAITSNAQQLIADLHSFSSFKHRVRMAYHEMTSMN